MHPTRTLSTPVHVCLSYASYGQFLYVGTFRKVVNIVEQGHYSREKGLPTQFTARRLIDPWVYSQFLSQHSHWSSGDKANLLLQTSYISLVGTYHEHVNSTFNTCSWGPTHRSLTDTGGGYNLGGVSFPHHTPRPSQPMVLRFPPKGPARSRVNHPTKFSN
jgi:hypothetical protein